MASTHLARLGCITEEQNRKIRACLSGERVGHFWYASCPMDDCQSCDVAALHDSGFDNYPFAEIPFGDWLFFYERLVGCALRVTEGEPRSFFNTWCEPLVKEPRDVHQLGWDLDNSPLWNSYMAVVKDYYSADKGRRVLPVRLDGLNPLDWACNVCGTERFLTFLYDAPSEAEYLLKNLVYQGRENDPPCCN